jgi:hypothetical protein
MDIGNENSTTMLVTSDDTLQKYISIWTGFAAMEQCCTDLDAVITGLQNNSLIRESRIKGTTEDKHAKEIDMVNAALKVSSSVYVYAVDINDNELKEKMDFPKSRLNRMRDTQKADACELIHESANAVIASLAPYNITAADLMHLQSKIDIYHDNIAKPKIAVNRKAVARIDEDLLIRRGKSILKKIDKLMEHYKSSQPDFYEMYFKSRNIIELGHRTHKPVCTIGGRVMDFVTEQPLGGVKIYIFGEENEVSSNAQGEFKLNAMKEGNALLVAELPGYLKYEEDVEMVKGGDIDLSIDLEPEEQETPEEPV